MNYNGENIEIINSHLKCCGDGILDTNDISDEENRRYRAMNMIKNYIDNNLQSSRVIFLGDLNKFKNLKYFIIDCLRYNPHPSHYCLEEVLNLVKFF